MKKENRELMEQMLMAIHAKDTLEMLEELIENSDTERIDRKKLLGKDRQKKAAGYYQKKS